MSFYSEEKYEDYLEQMLLSNGWEVVRQQPSDETMDWKNPYTLDLMIRRNDILDNQWIGLELKNFSGISKGGEFWKVIKQIKKYTHLSFKGCKIKYWCVAIPEDNLKYNYSNHQEDMINNRIMEFVRMFLNSMGVAILERDTIHFCHNNGKGIIDMMPKQFPHKPETDFIDNIIKRLDEWDIDFTAPKIDPWAGNRKCNKCYSCLDIEEIKFDNRCPHCGETVYYKSRTRGL